MTFRMTLVLLAGLGLAACQGEEDSIESTDFGVGAGAATSSVAGAPPPAVEVLGPIPGAVEPEPVDENPYAGDAEALREGRQLFVAYNCYGCHGGRAGGGMGPSLRDSTWLYGGSPANIFSSIALGRPHAMPAWGALLPAEILWKITAYIESLGTPMEPAAPEPLPVAEAAVAERN